MSVLSDKDIIKRLGENITDGSILISDLELDDVQPSSVDLHLGNEIKNIHGELICDLDKEEYYILEPNEFLLASTSEYIGVPVDLVGLVDGKSSLGRVGVTAHITAGWIDSGFMGNVTLEITNVSSEPFRLHKNMSICQIIFLTLTSPVELPYGHEDRNNHYQNSVGTVPSKYYDSV